MRFIKELSLLFVIQVLYCIPVSVSAENDPFQKISGVDEAFQPLPLGEIIPKGWLKGILVQDMKVMVGHMNEMVPALFDEDDIYGKDRLTRQIKDKDVGSTMQMGDGVVEYLWWNSETQSNWRDGYIRSAFLVRDSIHMKKAVQYVSRILATQDADGYLGIYAPDLRYKFHSENGELWAKASLLRSLLAYYELTGDDKVLHAVVRAVDNVMDNYPIYRSAPYKVETQPYGGLGHGLVFTDVLDQLARITHQQKYRDYALFLYKDYSCHPLAQEDVQYTNIMNPAYRLKCHGVHTYEHLRSLTLAAFTSGNPQLLKALDVYLARIERQLNPSGGPSGDEMIFEREADPTNIGYEYCSTHELFDAYLQLAQKTGDMRFADKAEWIYLNAALGARHPENGSICYLKTDNSYAMTGTRNGSDDQDTTQTRYKYSYVHQDNAVCCAPNAGRITPYYVQNMWAKAPGQIVSLLFGASELNTVVNGVKVRIVQQTDFPERFTILYKMDVDKPAQFTFKVRKPQWAKEIKTNIPYREENGMIVFVPTQWDSHTMVELELIPRIETKQFQQEVYFTYGPTVLALPIAANAYVSRTYVGRYNDLMYVPAFDVVKYVYSGNKPYRRNGKFYVDLENPDDPVRHEAELVPMRKTILRQVTFKMK